MLDVLTDELVKVEPLNVELLERVDRLVAVELDNELELSVLAELVDVESVLPDELLKLLNVDEVETD